MYAKAALNGGRRYYREWCDDLGESGGKSDGVSFQSSFRDHLEII
jgi:hypothetical protein